MSTESFRKSIYTVVEQISKIETSPTAKKLILHYFNSSDADTSENRAVEAIERYLQVSLSEIEISPRLRGHLERMAMEADQWDMEDGA